MYRSFIHSMPEASINEDTVPELLIEYKMKVVKCFEQLEKQYF